MDGALAPGAVVAGRYKVEETLARTPSSTLYAVTHVESGEKLALKLLEGYARLDPHAVERFRREARNTLRIESPHVVRVVDADTAPELDGAPFIVMELLRGSDLEAYAARKGPLAPQVVVAILAQVASVLEEAHGLGIVHRDLKPENLFLHERADGTTIAKVLDFGISKIVSTDRSVDAVRVTSTGEVLGTPLYMAPEQAQGRNRDVGPATDLWAVGLVALRLLAGESYWGRPKMAELILKITVHPLVAPSERWPGRMSSALDAWFFRSCDRDRSRRWPSASAQVAALAKALDVPLPTRVSAALALDGRAPVRRPRKVIVALGAAALGIAAVVPWLATRRPPAPPLVVTSAATSSPAAAAPPPTVLAAAESSAEPPKAVPEDAGRPSASARPQRAADSGSACPLGEVLSSGRCCPAGHVWQSHRCERPIATSF